MICKNEFIKLIKEYNQQKERVDKLCEVFQYSFEDPIINWGYVMFHKLIQVYFNDYGIDWIDYYLFENPEKCYYVDGKRIRLETISDLWNTVQEYRI